MEKPRLRGRRGGRRRMDEIRCERGVGGGAPVASRSAGLPGHVLEASGWRGVCGYG